MRTEQVMSSEHAAHREGRIDAPALRASDTQGASIVAGCAALTLLGVWLSVRGGALQWALGQMLTAVALLQWFIVLHEAGHLTLFRTRGLNIVAGHLAGALALIPFESWRRVHGLHHVWTGWQDLDPTTASLAPRARSAGELLLVDLAWRFWLPLFSVVYRIGNYWNRARLAACFTDRAARRRMAINAVLLMLGYAALIAALGMQDAARIFGIALLLSLALQDPLILSQHTHIAQRVSSGEPVKPFAPEQQASYTRSLRCPRGFARWVLFNFNAHELHHRYPGVPGYRLHAFDQAQANTVDWWEWLRAAKGMRGSVFLYENRDRTGFRL